MSTTDSVQAQAQPEQPKRPEQSAQFTAEVPEGAIVAWQSGQAQGVPVLILHGGPGLSDYTAPLADELDDAYRVIRYQQRGLAPSTLSGPFEVENHVADAIAVLDAAGIERAYVVGHSWGGHLAMHLALAHEDRLLGLVIVDPLGAVGDGGMSDLGRILGERATPELAQRARELDDRAMAGEGTAEEALESLAIIWPGYFSSPEKAPPMPDISLSGRCYAETGASVGKHLENKTLERALPEVTTPTVFVLGAASPIPPEHGIASAALIPTATYEVVDDCGHFIWLERPGAVRRALDRILP
jgi:pimeloyl-ACP methyl ester carboxylesterase